MCEIVVLDFACRLNYKITTFGRWILLSSSGKKRERLARRENSSNRDQTGRFSVIFPIST
jgi:hypothetical protein